MPTARRSGPSDSEVLAACVELKTANPEYGVKRVFAALLAAHPSWASLSERRVQKVMKAHALTPPPAAAAAPPAAAPPAGNDYAKQTVPELKALLKARGLKVGGKKADLVDRLAEADAVPN